MHEKAAWERLTDALLLSLVMKGLLTIDEHRRVMEDLPQDRYESLSYYQRWLTGIEALVLEKGLATREEIDRAFAESKG